MSDSGFGALFDKLDMPVVVCRQDADFSVVFLNAAAKMIFAPNLSVEGTRGGDRLGRLENILRFESPEHFLAFSGALRDSGSTPPADVNVLSYHGQAMPARVFAGAGSLAGDDCFLVFAVPRPGHFQGESPDSFMAQVLGVSHHITNIDDAIQSVIGLAGDYAKVSRVYIFEDIPGNATRNTYEWCAPGVLPAIQDLQRLDKADYNYDSIMNSGGMVITDDVSRLPDSDREILERQGIKAIAILPLYHFDDPLGYMGFDDCVGKRKWSLEEIQLLKNVASIVASLVNRRNAERESLRGRDIVQAVTDNLDDLVYVTDLETHEFKFVSQSLARALRKPVEEILGQPCWKILHRDQVGVCPFCNIPALLERRARGEDGPFVWELRNNVTGKWYMVKDNIIDWLDGEQAHLGTFVDITYRKQYEEQLKRSASTDAMTDVYNRTWGRERLAELFLRPEDERERMTLCFIDIDGLKRVNDTLGHAAGDDLIVNTIRTIFSCIRKADFVARWGGDEFVLFLNCGLEDARKVMGKIAFAIEHFNATADKPYVLSISHGLAGFAEPFAGVDELLAEADRRMYDNKLAKRGER